MALAPGTRLGPYEIVSALGAGGMGEVYRARDTKLNRDVALKVLPDSFANDSERLARFTREAQTLASLNHPNIAHIHGVEESAGVRALVMELVEGDDLSQRIARGPIAVDEAFPIARQMCEALEAAHEQGIIHRDFKPANIKVRPDGTVKVLDFGLAKATEPGFGSSASVSMSPTVTSPMTQAGMILGTAAYMSPEQARGKTVDKRADIWAFGVVLYEMLTGSRLFVGGSVPETLGLIFSRAPDLALLPATTPARVRTLITRCLVRDPRQRLRDIGDARLDLEPAHDEPARATPTPVRSVWRALPWGLAAAAGLLAGWMLWSRPSLSAPPNVRDEIRFEVTTPPTADPTSFVVSPDGKKLAFEATSGGRSRLWLRFLDAVPARPLAGTEDATSPFWSPDSRVIGFSANGQVKGIDIDTGTLQPLARSGAWNQDGAILFNRGGGGPIYRVAATGGEPTAVTPILQGSDQMAPRFLPDGHHFLFTAQGGTTPGVYVALLGGSEAPRRIINDAGVGAYASGYLLFVRQGTLFAQRFDPVRLQLEDRESVVADQIVTAGGRSFALSASEAGPIAYRTGPPLQAQFAWFDRSGTPLQTLAGSDVASFLNSSMSPDGRHLAFGRNVGGEAADIWLLDVRRGIATRFTDHSAFELIPVWSPDGRRLVYGSNRNGTFDVYMKSADGTGRETLLAGAEIGPPSDWSRDGRFILAQREEGQQQDIWAVSVDDRKAFPVVETKTFIESGGQFSPDGKWIAFQSNQSGSFEIYLQSFSMSGRQVRISSDGGVQARWRDDGKELVYLAPDNRLMAVPIELDPKGGSVEAGRPLPLFATRLPMSATILNARHYMMSPDGQKFLVQTAKEVTLPITVILNLKDKP